MPCAPDHNITAAFVKTTLAVLYLGLVCSTKASFSFAVVFAADSLSSSQSPSAQPSSSPPQMVLDDLMQVSD
jgi:hypothetical protein